MNQVLKVVKDISCQTTVMRLSLSASDKAAVDECNKQMALACGIFGVRNHPPPLDLLLPDAY